MTTQTRIKIRQLRCKILRIDDDHLKRLLLEMLELIEKNKLNDDSQLTLTK